MCKTSDQHCQIKNTETTTFCDIVKSNIKNKKSASTFLIFAF